MMFLAQTDKEESKKFIDEQVKALEEQYNNFNKVKKEHNDKMDNFMSLVIKV